mgnify:CR=1 FL=1
MATSHPFLSIIIPTRNRSTIVQRAIRSVINQTIDGWECIVVDDHSTDNTREVIQQLHQQDPRIAYLGNQADPGAQGARNTGIQQAQGQWILLLDSDNTISPNYLEQITNYTHTHPNVDVVTNYVSIIKENGIIEHQAWPTHGNILHDLLTGKTYVDNSSTCIRKTVLDAIIPLDTRCPSYQEWDTHIRLSQIAIYGCIEEELTQYYDHTGPRVSSRTDTIWAHGLYVLHKHRKLWLNIVGKDVYTRMLLQVYEERHTLSMPRQWLVSIIVVVLSPKLGKQLIKRRLQ